MKTCVMPNKRVWGLIILVVLNIYFICLKYYTHMVYMFTCIYGESEDMLYTEKHIYMSIYVCAYIHTYIHMGR